MDNSCGATQAIDSGKQNFINTYGRENQAIGIELVCAAGGKAIKSGANSMPQLFFQIFQNRITVLT